MYHENSFTNSSTILQYDHIHVFSQNTMDQIVLFIWGFEHGENSCFSWYSPMVDHKNCSHKPNCYFLKPSVSKLCLILPEESFSWDTLCFVF